MTFTPNIPATGTSLGESRPLIVGNFTNYNTVLSVNHVAPNASGQGKHKFLQMPVQASAPSTASGEGGIYVKTAGSQSIPFYRKDNLTLDFPLLPIRAMVRFSVGAVPSIVGTALNVSAVAQISSQQYKVTFSENLPDANYLVIAMGVNTAATPICADPSNYNVSDFILNILSSLTGQISVIVLHYVTV